MTKTLKLIRGIAYADTDTYFMTDKDLGHICFLIDTSTPLKVTLIPNAKAFYFECPIKYDFEEILNNLYETIFKYEPIKKLMHLHEFCLHFYPKDHFDFYKLTYDDHGFGQMNKPLSSYLSISAALRIIQDPDSDELDLCTEILN